MKIYAPSGEPLCNREAYAAVSASDDCNFSFKLTHLFLLGCHFDILSYVTIK
jgi:hypothetical protein